MAADKLKPRSKKLDLSQTQPVITDSPNEDISAYKRMYMWHGLPLGQHYKVTWSIMQTDGDVRLTVMYDLR